MDGPVMNDEVEELSVAQQRREQMLKLVAQGFCSRNISLNSRLGFEVEGIFLEDQWIDGERQDIVRMALLKPMWLQIFAPESPVFPGSNPGV